MKNFKQFTQDVEQALEEANTDWQFLGRKRGVSTWKNGSDIVTLDTWTDRKKTGKGGKLRDPSGTKWKLQIKENSKEVFYKAVARAEDMDAINRKKKVVQSALKFLNDTYGIDAYNELWIEGGLPKPSKSG